MSSLWLLSVLTLFIVACVTSLPAEVKDEKEEEASVEKRSGYDCYIQGRRYRHGEIFSYPGFSHCVKYRCNNGGYSVVQSACERNGRCVPVGSVVREKCRSLRCTRQNAGNVNYYRLEPTHGDRCEVEGRCVEKNKAFVHSNCATYRCVPTRNGGYNFQPTGDLMCKDDRNRCHGVGATFSKFVNGHYYRNCVCRGGGMYQCRG